MTTAELITSVPSGDGVHVVNTWTLYDKDRPARVTVITAVKGCETCSRSPFVLHDNCLYRGRSMGHSATHCTADACY